MCLGEGVSSFGHGGVPSVDWGRFGAGVPSPRVGCGAYFAEVKFRHDVRAGSLDPC